MIIHKDPPPDPILDNPYFSPIKNDSPKLLTVKQGGARAFNKWKGVLA